MEVIRRVKVRFEDEGLNLLKHWMPTYESIEIFESGSLLMQKHINNTHPEVGEPYLISEGSFVEDLLEASYIDDYDTLRGVLNHISTDSDKLFPNDFMGHYLFKVSKVESEIYSTEDKGFVFNVENMDNAFSLIEDGVFGYDDDYFIIIDIVITLIKD